MPGLADLVPDADTLLALAPEDLGMILLKLVQAERSENVAPSNFETSLWSVTRPGYPYSRKKDVSLAFAEAWQWLQNEGLLIAAPGTNGYFCLTRKGARMKSQVEAETYLQGNLLPPGAMHPKLAEKIRPMFLRGDYTIAVQQSFIEVEIAVREAAGMTNDDIGVEMMRTVFSNKSGKLADPNATGGERVAMMELFAGAIGYCKNPPSHRRVETARVSAAQLIGLASHLLWLVETAAARLKKASP